MKITNLIENIEVDFIEEFANDVLIGLSSDIKSIPSIYFYDQKGSQLFQKITSQDEYYLTRKEFEILEKESTNIAMALEEDEIDLIELGAGDGHKSILLINGLIEKGIKVNYYPIDISKEALIQLDQNIKSSSKLTIHGVVGEYISALKHLKSISKNKKLVLFLGSNIGNFDRVQNQIFFKKLWKNMNDSDYLLTGFDLKKSPEIMNSAYNDSEGFTAEFNINLLSRINKELGGNFNEELFEHYGSYNPILGAMESFLISKETHSVFIKALNRTFYFEENEPIHLEYSFKFSSTDIQHLAKKTGCKVIKDYRDEENYFTDSLWQINKEQYNEQ
ncbi:L-histidine N(alpha)-methyltransferase [Halobacteriovorax sp.]|uniref:L-histidine N(alpha)-methyltransferase n=1 Tax=Halobacteriovorax sp. TaxID=2020862 RepID=UPI003568B936